MGYDIVDAFVEIKELQQALKVIVEKLVEKGVMEKPPKEQEGQK